MKETAAGGAILWLRLLGLAAIPLLMQAVYPPVGEGLRILIPLPLAYGAARRGMLEGTLAVSLAALASSLLLGWGAGIFFLLETMPLCLGVAWVVKSRQEAWRSLLSAVGLVLLALLAAVLFFAAASGQGVGQSLLSLRETVAGLAQEASAGLTANGSDLPPEAAQRLQWMLGIWVRLFAGIWLSTLLLLTLLYSALVRVWMIQAGRLEPEEKGFISRWRLPFPFVGLFVAVALVLITSRGVAGEVALNLLLPLGTLYGIQGLAVTGHVLSLWSLPPVLRVLLLLILALQFPLAFIIGLALLGLFDTWFDFRRRFVRKDRGAPPPGK